MEFPIKFDTVKSRWSIVYYIMRGHRLYFCIFQKFIVSLSLKIDFSVENSADPDEIPHHAAFHLGLHCLSKSPYVGFLVFTGLRN